MNSDAGRVLKARKPKQVPASPAPTAASEFWCANPASATSAVAPSSPKPDASASTFPSPSTAIVTAHTRKRAPTTSSGPTPVGPMRAPAATAAAAASATAAALTRSASVRRSVARPSAASATAPTAATTVSFVGLPPAASPMIGPSATREPARRRTPRELRLLRRPGPLGSGSVSGS